MTETAEPSTPASETSSPSPEQPQADHTDMVELFRGQRDKWHRRALAAEQILQAHGVKFDDHLNDEALSKLPLYKGTLEGFNYKPPKIQHLAATPQQRMEGKTQPTLEDVKGWSHEKINKNWETVKNLMKKGNSK